MQIEDEVWRDVLAFLRSMAIDCKCDEEDAHDEAREIMERHGIDRLSDVPVKLEANQRFVVFFYLLVRDHLPMGVVERLILEACKTVPNKEVCYSNKQLQEWASERTRLLLSSKPSPFVSMAWLPDERHKVPHPDNLIGYEEKP